MWRRGLIAVFLLAICGLGAQPADLPGASPRALAFSRRAAGAAQIVDLPATYRCPGCSVVLISIDTLRADHLGTYGYSAPTSPGIDRFALDSAVFRDAIAVAPSTLRSHASIFASVFPHQHGARRHPPAAVPEEALTIAELPTTISVDRIDELSREAQPRGTFDPADVSQVVRAYDGGIRSVDEAFGELVEQLRRRRVYDGALIVFVSDHGEELGEHGTVGHHPTPCTTRS